ncbi:MAG: deoxyhypusine synthase [Nanoarchaeota archaeon]|nr:deoxyhypusine synthase [Nanoarchaeota archaeon]
MIKNKINKEKILKPKKSSDAIFRAIKKPTPEDIARGFLTENVFRKSEEASGLRVEGYDFDSGADYVKIIDSFASTGFQATQLSRAMEIVNKMRKGKAFIYLGYTSNLVTSGLRDIFRYLAENKMIDVIVSTAGGIEEDIIKCLGDFKIGSFSASGKELRDKGINRAGNVFISNNNYVKFEEFLQQILEELYSEKKTITSSELIWKLGEKINDKKSIYYHCYKNKIPVYCPAITDGAIGDNLYFFSFKHPDFKLDIMPDVVWFNNTTIGKKKTGAIILGAGVIKHSILNANMLRNGCDYAVYINTSAEYDGSDSGAMPDEAVSWGKITKNAESVKVFGDATILFPLIAAQCFAENQ